MNKKFQNKLREQFSKRNYSFQDFVKELNKLYPSKYVTCHYSEVSHSLVISGWDSKPEFKSSSNSYMSSSLGVWTSSHFSLFSFYIQFPIPFFFEPEFRYKSKEDEAVLFNKCIVRVESLKGENRE